MGWRGNYRWLRYMKSREFPSIDQGKIAATKAERRVLKRVKKLPEVIQVYHERRLNHAAGGRHRREVDALVLLKDGIALIEVKNFNGTISMDEEGNLYQNKKSRGWNFTLLTDAKTRLISITREVGIILDNAPVHLILAFAGKGSVEDSVIPDKHELTGSHVARSTKDVIKILQNTSKSDTSFDKETLEAIMKFLDMCGTWDTLEFENKAEQSGDIIDSDLEKKWRPLYKNGKFENQRGWLASFLFGPQYVGYMTTWEGTPVVIQVDPSEELLLSRPGSGNQNQSYRLDMISSFAFGYQTIPNWSEITLIEKEEKELPPSENKESKVSNTPPYKVGDVINDATVKKHLGYGIIFQLHKRHTGLYKNGKMSELEWATKDVMYSVGKVMDVKVTNLKWNQRNKRWDIVVRPTD